MSLLDQASLVLVPSAIKTGEVLVQKPLPTKFSDETGNYDGNDPTTNANLTFTRNSNATRVNADGKVERVRTNLILQSNTFNTTWTNTSSTETSGQAGYDGSNDAWKIDITAAFGQVIQSVSISGVSCASIYVKAGTLGFVRLRFDAATNAIADFNLSNGSVGYSFGIISASSTAIGGGWYRVSMVSNVSSSTFRIYPIVAANDLTATSGNIYIQDAQLETGDIATDYIPTTTSARSTFAGISVDGTSVPNVPRLDYSGGATCGSLLLEPQRTNLLYASEDLTATYWNKYGGQTVTGNDAISPDGYQNADKMVDAGGVFQQRAFSPSTAYALSVFIKKDTATSFRLGFVDYQSAGYFGGDIRYTFATGAITVTQSLNSSVSGEAVDYGNGWIRLICKFTTNASQNYNYQFAEYDGGTGWSWGYQLEAGSYATSLISTQSASVTRLADSASRTNIANLIGQTEGTIFLEFDATENAGQNMNLINFNNSLSASALIRKTADGRITGQVIAGGSSVFAINSIAVTGVTKAAFAYKSGDSVLYVNGTAYSNSSTFTFGAALSELRITASDAYFNFPHKFSANQALLFPTRLDNATLANLTTL